MLCSAHPESQQLLPPGRIPLPQAPSSHSSRPHSPSTPLRRAGTKMVRTRGGKDNWVLPPDAGVPLGDHGVQLKEEDGVTAATVMVPAAAAAPRVEIAVEFDKSLLDCSLCSLPLKPPVFQCPAKHAACGPCAASQANKCPACDDGAYERDEAADRYLLAVRVPCPNQPYGCGSSVVYCMAGDHRLVCPHAPCRCPEPGCGFLGPPPALRGHLAERHAWPVTDITYGSVLEVQMQAVEQGRRLLAAEDGERLFLFVASERGVKVVRVAAPAEEEGPAASWYRCKVWVHAPVDTDTGQMDVLMLDAKVQSCAVPSEEAATGAGGRYLPVPSDVPAPDGGGIVVRLRIDKQV